MRQHIRKLIAVGAVVVVGLTIWLVDLRNGSALEGGGYKLGLPLLRKGDDFYVMAPAVSNKRGQSVKLVGVKPHAPTAGLEFLEARVYSRSDFPGGVPMSWSRATGPGGDPAELESAPIGGQVLAGHQTLDDIILVHVRVTSDQSPLRADGFRFTYRLGLRDHDQVIDADLEITRPS